MSASVNLCTCSKVCHRTHKPRFTLPDIIVSVEKNGRYMQGRINTTAVHAFDWAQIWDLGQDGLVCLAGFKFMSHANSFFLLQLVILPNFSLSLFSNAT